MGAIPPFQGIAPPYVLEIGYLEPYEDEYLTQRSRVERINERTVRVYADHIGELPI